MARKGPSTTWLPVLESLQLSSGACVRPLLGVTINLKCNRVWTLAACWRHPERAEAVKVKRSDRQWEGAALVMALIVAIPSYLRQYMLDCLREYIRTVKTGLGE